MALVQKNASWNGYSKLEYLIVLSATSLLNRLDFYWTSDISGDSYSDVGYSPHESPPNDIEPLGVPFPGITFADSDGPNWVAICYIILSLKDISRPTVYYVTGGLSCNRVQSISVISFRLREGWRNDAQLTLPSREGVFAATGRKARICTMERAQLPLRYAPLPEK